MVACLVWSGVSLVGDSVALARVEVQPLGGKLVSARAFASDGSEIPLHVSHGELTPLGHLMPASR
jgi:hypothetical protein